MIYPSLLLHLKNCGQRRPQKELSPQDQGFALPLAMGLGLVMLVLGVTTILVAQGDRSTAFQRKETGSSLAVTEGGVARTLAKFVDPDNAILLGRNYDSINPETGKTHLGPDGIFNSGDEENTAIDEWTNYDPSGFPCFQQKNVGTPNLDFTGKLGGAGTYKILAYRYIEKQGIGSIWVEGTHGAHSSVVAISIQIKPDLSDFPGLLTHQPYSGTVAGLVALRGRAVLGSKGNIYYPPATSNDPSLKGISSPGESTRPDYLQTVWSTSTQDGASGDNISGQIFACDLTPTVPESSTFAKTTETDLGVVNTSQILKGTGGQIPTVFVVDQIDLENNETLTVDTTSGPVIIRLQHEGYNDHFSITLRNTAKILNTRTDALPPRVGDLRIMGWGNNRITLTDQTCIQGAFLWSRIDELRLLTSGAGCPGGKNTNFEGVVWVEAIFSSKNDESNRNISYLGDPNRQPDATITPNATSGIAVPEDVPSFSDLLKYVNMPMRYQFGGIQSWQRLRL